MNTFRFNIADDVICIWRNVLGNMYVKRAVIKWLSRTVFKTSSNDVKRMFRDLEKLNLKLVSLESHRTFNETCINIFICITYILSLYILHDIFFIFKITHIVINLWILWKQTKFWFIFHFSDWFCTGYAELHLVPHM